MTRAQTDRDLTDVLALAFHSPRHAPMPLIDALRGFLPPIALGQYLLLRGAGRPVAYLSWARLTDETSDRWRRGVYEIMPPDWAAGSNIWVVDVIAAPGCGARIIRRFRDSLPSGAPVRFVRVGAGGRRRVGMCVARPKAA